MELDEEIETKLSLILNNLRTNDKDVLLSHFQNLINNTLDDTDAMFFLDMHNWKLREAVNDYYEYSTGVLFSRLSMKFVEDYEQGVLILNPCKKFSKSYQIYNDGKVIWPENCQLSYFAGNPIAFEYPLPEIKPLMPTECQALIVNFISPEIPAKYIIQLRLLSPHKTWFGDIIWLIIYVQKQEEINMLSEKLSSIDF